MENNSVELYIFGPDDQLMTSITEETGLYAARFKEGINQVSSFTFTVDATAEAAAHVVEENQVVFRDKEGDFRLFVIKEPTDRDGPDGPETEAVCEPWYMELKEHIVLDRRFVNQTADVALNAALEGTRATGRVIGELGRATTNFYRLPAIDAIWEIPNVWGGELKDVVEFDGSRIKARRIELHMRRGADRGKVFEIDHDIEEIERTVLSYPLTAMYGWGASLEIEDEQGEHTGGYTRYIDFADVEWSKAKGDPVDKPKGQKWVGDPAALQRYGRLHNGKRLHREGQYSNHDIEDPAELLEATWLHLQDVKEPEVNYRLSVALLERLAGYEHEHVQLGDTAAAIDREFSREIVIQSRVISIEYDIIDIEATGIVEMGQFLSAYEQNLGREIDEIRNELNDTRSRADRPVTNDRFLDVKPGTPSNVLAAGGFRVIQLYWNYDSNVNIAHYEVYGSQVASFVPDSQHLLYRGRTSAFSHEVNTDETWYYYVRAVNQRGTPGEYSVRASAATVRLLSDDILFGEILAEHLSDNLDIAEKLAQDTIDRINAGPLEEVETARAEAIENAKAALEAAKKDATEKANTARSEAISAAEQALETARAAILDAAATDAYTKASAAQNAAIKDAERKISAAETRLNTAIGGKADANSVYTITEVDNALKGKVSTSTYTTDQNGIINRLDNAETSIEQNATAITSKASTEVVNGIAGRVETAETTITQQAGMISSKAEKAYVDTVSGVASSAKTTAEQTAEGLRSKAETATVNALTGRVETAETTISQHATAISSKAEKSTVDTVSGVANSAKTLAEQTAEGLKSKAETKTVNALSGRVETAESTISQHAGLISSKVDAKYVTGAIADLNINDRNLIRNSGLFKNRHGWTSGTVVMKDGVPVLQTTGTLSNVDDLALEPGTEYVITMVFMLSFDFNATNNVPNHIYVRYPGESTQSAMDGSPTLIGGNRLLKANEWHTVSLRFKTKADTTKIPYIKYHLYPSTVAGTRTLKSIKLQKGSKATDWTPAPEDFQTQIDSHSTLIEQNAKSITSKASQSSVDTLSGTVSSHTTTLSQHASSIASKAEKSYVDTVSGVANSAKSTAEQTAEAIKTKVESSTFNALAGRVETAESTITQHAGLISSKVDATYVDRATSIVDGDVGSVKIFKDVLAWQQSAVTLTGMLVIRTPITGRQMTHMSISGYNYRNNNAVIDLEISFYNFTTSITSHGFVSKGSREITKVRAARAADGSVILFIGDETDTWSYPHITIDKVKFGYVSTPDSYANGWSAEISQSMPSDITLLTNLGGMDYGSTLTKHSSEISQNAIAITQRVTTSTFNALSGRVSTAEGKITTMAGEIDLRVTKNGVIAGINVTPETIRINGAKIHLTGQTLIDDAIIGTTAIANAAITNAKIGNLAVSTGQIQNGAITNAKIGNLAVDDAKIASLSATKLIAGTLDTSKVTVRGGSSTSYTRIDGPLIESRGQFTRTWQGKTATHDVIMSFRDGYFRASNAAADRNLYYSDFGISTYASGNQDESSGTIEFFSYDYHPTRKGLTISSVGGVAALRSGLEKVIIDAYDHAYIRSNRQQIRIQPRNHVAGNNTFTMHVVDNGDPSLQDGILFFGSESNPKWSSGLRFSKQLNSNTVSITDGDGGWGTGNLEALNVKVNNRMTGAMEAPVDNAFIHVNNALKVVDKGAGNSLRDLEVRNAIMNEVIFGSLRTGDVNSNTYIGVGSYELRVTNNQFYNGGNTVYRAVRASAFNQGSSRAFKTDIKPVDDIGLEVVRSLTVVDYMLKEEAERGLMDRHIGFIAEDSAPIATSDKKAVNMYAVSAYNTKAIKELDSKHSDLEGEVSIMKLEIQYLKQKIKKLECA
ncbi:MULTISPECIES: phage tail protein [Bhargavaea]|uniref:Phage tail protein n=1 Tax=Bhargavaea changchunensis TaxID=2134037 RepID=A0ABW2NEG0_9BACL|nr:tail fiber domain-containing protein [Bhargavaea sp. CC-171006]